MSEDSPCASSVQKDLIYQPKENDVLLGRGSNTTRHPGNERFRLLVAERKWEYNASRKHPRKKVLAQEVFDAVHASGGRFLKQVEYDGPESDEEEGAWYAVEVSEALEKCKQALREKSKPKKRGIGADTGEMTKRDDSGTFTYLGPVSLPGVSSTLTPVLPPMLAREHLLCGVNSHLALFQDTPQVFHPSMVRQDRHLGGALMLPEARRRELLQAIHQQLTPSTLLTDNPLYSRMQGSLTNTFPLHRGGMTEAIPNGSQLRPSATDRGEASSSSTFDETTRAVSVSEEDTRAVDVTGEDVSGYLLSYLEYPDLPRFTEADAEAERASLTEAEKDDALVDMFGKYCTTSPSKRIKRDLDQASIQFLVKQMRLEIERIPENKKRALLEAQSKCDAEEFSDSRIERFLRGADMDPKLGAQRFVNYWERRKEVFGSERYLRRMSLSEALCNEDVVALEAGLLCPLPVLDCSGRQVVLLVPCHDTRDGYTLENMLRAYWYVMEVLAQEDNHAGSGIVKIIWDKHSTIFDYDLRLYERFITFETCLPVRVIAYHSCCPPWYTVKILKPILQAFINKWIRSRVAIHEVPESQIPEVLSNYGILKEMLPTCLGGNLDYSIMEWIANRRAVELEEI